MMNEEKRMKLYHLNNSNRKIRSRMAKTLHLTREGEFERANQILSETRDEFEQMKKDNEGFEDSSYESSLGFTEVFHDAVSQANRLYSRNCSAVKFHVYN